MSSRRPFPVVSLSRLLRHWSMRPMLTCLAWLYVMSAIQAGVPLVVAARDVVMADIASDTSPDDDDAAADALDWPCAHHRCGCASAEDCAKGCCCAPSRQDTKASTPTTASTASAADDAPSPAGRTTDFLLKLACQPGDANDGGITLPTLLPHLPAAPTPLLLPMFLDRLPTAAVPRLTGISPEPPAKVPIDRAA